MQRKKSAWFVIVGAVAAVVAVGGFVPALFGPAAPSPSSHVTVSYNPAPADRFQAPLSSIGLVGVTGAKPGDDGGFLPAPGISALVAPQVSGPNPNSVRFIADQSYMPQSETTLTTTVVDGSTYAVGGYNDARFFFCSGLPSSDCPSSWTYSLSGFTVARVAGNGGATSVQVLASDDLPGLLYSSTGHPSFPGFLASWGDPATATGTEGQIFYASLAIDPVTGNNGIELAVSNSMLISNATACVTTQSTPWSNPCWDATLVYGSLTGYADKNGKVFRSPATFEDKELIAVDHDASSPYFGDVYVTWDHFNANGTSASYGARCTPALVCTMISGGGVAPLSGLNSFVAWTMPAVGPDGSVYVSFCNYGTFTTLGPVTCSVARSGAGGTSFGAPVPVLTYVGVGPGWNSPALQNATVIVGWATEQYRTSNIPVIAVDTSLNTSAGSVYFVIALCTSPHTYYGFSQPTEPGLCGQSAVYLSKSANGGATWSSPKVVSPSTGWVNDQPWVTVDPSNGWVVVTFYTSAFDPFQHRLDVLATVGGGGGTAFHSVRVTTVSDEPDSDPAYFDYFTASGFGGSFIVPQFGDYFQSVANDGTIWSLSTADYAPELGTYQADPFLTSAAE